MNKENLSKWIAALRSGKYKQGVGALKYPETSDVNGPCLHCAVGVACEVMNPNGFYLKESEKSDDGVIIEVKVFYFKSLDALPEWLGVLAFSIGIIERLNDENRFTFNEIADYLEVLLED